MIVGSSSDNKCLSTILSRICFPPHKDRFDPFENQPFLFKVTRYVGLDEARAD
jgi:hypothetical protein